VFEVRLRAIALHEQLDDLDGTGVFVAPEIL
jgi:hypothetical protein